MKTIGLAALVLAALAVAPGVAGAAEVLRSTVLPPNPYAMTPPPAPLAPPRTHPVRPFVQPGYGGAPVGTGPCCTAGRWGYQWVPTAYTTYVWVPGYVTDGGVLVGGGYQPQVITGGYYQQIWIGD